jgi:hypothetical protein
MIAQREKRVWTWNNAAEEGEAKRKVPGPHAIPSQHHPNLAAAGATSLCAPLPSGQWARN